MEPEGALMRRAHPLTLVGTFVVVAIAALCGACGAIDITATPDAKDAGADVTTEASADAGADTTAPPVAPYPPGPYGAGIGQRMADFGVLGYGLSRQQRDAKKLPYRRITLGEARTPGCECMLVVWDAAGTCFPSIQEYQTLSSALMRDPTLCAMEVIAFNFDSAAAGGRGAAVPATRADLDEWVGAGFQPYPVGLATTGSDIALGSVMFDAIPQNIVVRPSDMTILGYIDGLGDDLVGTMKKTCATPKPGPEDVATGLAPSALVVDDARAILIDAVEGVLSFDLGTTKKSVLLPSTAGPMLLAHDASRAYVATRAAGVSSIVAIDKATSSTTTIATGSASFTSLATGEGNVYFTRDDGVVGFLAGSGGPITTVASTESAPYAVDVAGGRAYFIAGGEVVSVVLPGGSGPARSVIVAKGSITTWYGASVEPTLLVARTSNLFLAGTTARGPSAWNDQWITIRTDGLSSPPAWSGMPVVALGRSTDGSSVVRAVSTSDRKQGGLVALPQTAGYATITAGAEGVNAASMNERGSVFTIGESAPGKRDGALRRIAR